MKNVFVLCLLLFSFAAAQYDSTGIRLIEAKRYTDAKVFFSKACKDNSKDAESRFYLAQVHMRLRELDEAEECIDEAIEINEKVAKYHLLRGSVLGQQAMSANIFSQGILAPKIKNAFLAASELDPTNIEARQALFSYYLMAPGIMGGSDEKALAQCQAVKAIDPFRGALLYANYHRRKSEFDLQERYLQEAVRLQPSNGQGYKQLGYFYRDQKQFEKAQEHMKKYISIDPKNPDAYDSFADVLKDQGLIEQAIQNYFTAIALDNTYSSSYYALAECYESKNEKGRAKEWYQKYLEKEPEGRRANRAKDKIKEL